MATEDIQIRISVLDEATPYLENISKSVSSLSKINLPQIKGLGGFDRISVSVKGLDKNLSQVADTMQGFRNVMGRNKGLFGDWTQFKDGKKEMADFSIINKNFGKGLDNSLLPIKENISGFNDLGSALRFAGISEKDFSKWQKQNFFTMDNGTGLTNQLTGDTLSYGRSVQYATLQNRRFKMEWLSIMFAGMALSRTFDSIVNAQMALWGWSEGLASMWDVIMAPAMERLSTAIWYIIQKIMELPEDTQLVIGITVLGLDWLGKIVTVIGEAYLALQGLKILFPQLVPALAGGLPGVFKAIGTAISGISVGFLATVVIIIALIASIVFAFKENFMGMKKIVTDLWDYIKQMFGGIFQIFKGVFDLIKALLKGDGDAIMKAVGNIIIGVLNLIIGAIGLAVNVFQTIMVGSVRLLVGIVQGVINGLIAGASAIMKLLGGKGISLRIDLLGLIGKLDMSLPKLPKIPSLATGGYIEKEGLAYLHAGETVVPKGQNGINFSPNVTINATISNSYDVRQLADELNTYWAQNFQRTMRSRGSI